MNRQQVFQEFSELAELDGIKAEKYRGLCDNAVYELEEMLKDKACADNADCGGRLSAAAAAMAFCKYTLICRDADVTGFKAGELDVKLIQKYKLAENYLEQCMKSIAPYIRDKGFVFRGVMVSDISDNLRTDK